MEDGEISAFAAYSNKNLKKKLNNTVGFKVKSKHKLKKKKKSQLNNANSVMNALFTANYSKTDNLTNKSGNKHLEKRDLIKSLLMAEKESLFKNCNLTTKVENVFLKTNEENGSKKNKVKNNEKIKKKLDDKTEFKKSKKKKLDRIPNGESSESFHTDTKSEESFNLKKKKKLKNKNTVLKNEVVKLSQNKLKESSDSNSKLLEIIYSDSVKVGEEVFSWLLSPMTMKDFFKTCWEEKPLHITHNNESYYKCVCSMEDFRKALRKNDMYFTRNIDVTSYVNGERFTENPEGKAKPSIVWDLYRKGKSIRLLNPQTFIPNIQILSSTLQEFFQCFVGANIYLTPPGTQGFAPHYDDIEAFVLQLEGEKQWKLYNPRSPEEVLPRESSRNFREDEIGEPILEVTLRPGDLLYFPRGIIHQAKCLPHVHSLHITVSCYQKNSWADLLEKLLPVALQRAISEDVEFRRGLPLGWLNHLGMVYSDKESEQRAAVVAKFEELVRKVLDYCPLDAGADQVGAGFMHDALPPAVSEEEKVYGGDRNYDMFDSCLLDALKNNPERNLGVKLIRACCVRLVSEGADMVLYYTTDNSLVYREHEACSAEVPTHWAQAIDFLIHSYPKFVDMKDLPVSERLDKAPKWKRIADFVHFLWQKGLLLFDRPLRLIHSRVPKVNQHNAKHCDVMSYIKPGNRIFNTLRISFSGGQRDSTATALILPKHVTGLLQV